MCKKKIINIKQIFLFSYSSVSQIPAHDLMTEVALVQAAVPRNFRLLKKSGPDLVRFS